jgi:hypothetical protein
MIGFRGGHDVTHNRRIAVAVLVFFAVLIGLSVAAGDAVGPWLLGVAAVVGGLTYLATGPRPGR